MNNAAAVALYELIQEYGLAVPNTPRSFEILLRQKAKAYPAEIDALLVALKHDVIRKLAAKPKQNREGLGRWLRDQAKMPEPAAIWAVEAWASAIGIGPKPKPGTDWSSVAVPPVAEQSRRRAFVVGLGMAIALLGAAAYYFWRSRWPRL